MTINPDYIQHAVLPPSPRMQFVGRDGILTGPAMQFLQNLHDRLNGLTPIVSCECTGTNVLTLTPVRPSPLVDKYTSYTGFAFVGANTSTGTMTGFVDLPSGPLATIKVYINRGATQASTNDVIAGSFYVAFFVDSLDGGNGGFVL